MERCCVLRVMGCVCMLRRWGSWGSVDELMSYTVSGLD